jgi:hypothetical protein
MRRIRDREESARVSGRPEAPRLIHQRPRFLAFHEARRDGKPLMGA